MRITQNTELAIVVALVIYTAFTSGFQPVRQMLSTGVGKAVGLAAIVATWKYVSPLIALLLTIDFIRCATLREGLENPPSTTTGTTPKAPASGSTLPPNTYCPDNYSFDNGQCKNKSNDQTIPASVCLAGQTWDGTKCQGSSAATTAAPETTTTKQPFTNMTPSPVAGGFQPDMKEKFSILAPAYV